MTVKILVLGIGNPIRFDDAVGIETLQELRKIFKNNSGLSFEETSEAGLNLIDLISGHEMVIIIDSVFSEEGEVGNIFRLTKEDLKMAASSHSTHSLNLPSILEFGEKLNLDLPKKIIYYAIKIDKNEDFGEGLTLKIKNSMPKLVQKISVEINNYLNL